ncbi:sigma factor-like helix-turn-helix DNA-binding protein [Trueperella pyogenes]|uniref:sigma factor-like helix-turn-helix DNA-binding protein n=1 Tax=Trueperella pyogenes TaxID=1661 RepID=UPI00345D7031
MKLTIKSEPINNSTGARYRSDSFEITDSDATVLIDWDYSQQCADPTIQEPVRRSAQEVADEQFSKPEYNNWHGYHRQDREGAKFSSFEVWNEHGDQPVGAASSPEEIYLARLDDEARVRRDQIVRAAINALPPVQRTVVEAIFDDCMRPVDVAAERGVSKVAISQTLKKALKQIEQVVLASGVNDPSGSGFPLSGTAGAAQEGRTS